jgi:hypothetical protein
VKEFFIPCKKNKYKPYLLGKTAIAVYSVFLILVNSFGGLIGISKTYASEITTSNIIYLTNQARSSGDLNTLNENAKLDSAALAKANNMFELQYWDHYGPNGESPWQFIKAAGYDYVYAGENLAKGFRTAEGVQEAWMASTTHRANIMSANYEDIGIAVVTGVLEGSQTILVVQMFGSQNASSSSATTDNTNEEENNNQESEETETISSERGEIKAIMITNPKTGDTLNDPTVNIEGGVENINGEYSVDVYDNGESVGSTDSQSSDTWEFDKNSDWSEGSHEVQAAISGTETTSDKVSFTIDSDPPEIDESSIKVVHGDSSFTITFSANEEISDAILVSGDKSFELEKTDSGTITGEVKKSDLEDTVDLVVSDVLGNSTVLDVSEYFVEEDNSTKVSATLAGLINSIGTADKINIIVASAIFLLLCIEVYIYWKKNKLRNITNDLFALGFWWLLLVVGATTGFAGFVN